MNSHEIIEFYPDGGKWTHYAHSYEDAEVLADAIVHAHPARKVAIRRIEEDEDR